MRYSPVQVVKTALAALCVSAALLTTAPAAASTRPRAADGSYGAYVLGRLAAASGFGAHVRLGRAPVTFAQAVVVEGGEAILYNPQSLDRLERATGSPWAAVSVIAHELGHHYYGHSKAGTLGLDPEAIHDCELDADYFSGHVLARLGASLEDAQTAQRTLDDEETAYHPSAARRLRAIASGWLDARDGLPLNGQPAWRRGDRVPPQGGHLLPAAGRSGAGEPLGLAVGRW